MKTKTFLLAFMISFTAVVISTNSQAQFNEFLLIEHETSERTDKETALNFYEHLDAVSRFREVELNENIKSLYAVAEEDLIILNLFSDAEYVAEVQRVEEIMEDNVTITAKLQSFEFAYMIISTTEGRSLVTVRVQEAGRIYQILRDPFDVNYYLIELDPQKMIADDELPIQRPPAPTPYDIEEQKRIEQELEMRSTGPWDPATIDVMMVYTQAARTWGNNNGGIRNLVATAIADGNVILSNSNTVGSFRLVHNAEVNYTESASLRVDLRRLTTSTTFQPWGSSWTLDGVSYNMLGFMDVVHTWRNTYGADLVLLFTATGSGVGWILEDIAGRPNYGFSISNISRLYDYTPTHEKGHNLGLHHHKEQNIEPGPTNWGTSWPANTWSAGWRWQGSDNAWYSTVMSYRLHSNFPSNPVTSTVVPYFSSPLINYLGAPTGHSADGDNARTLRTSKHVVAAYRSAATINCIECPGYNFTINPGNSWSTHSSSIVSGGCKIYRVAVEKGKTYTFKTGCGNGATANFDTFLELLNDNCTQLAANDDGCEDYRSIITWMAPYTGYAYVKVRGWGSASGTYTMAYQRTDDLTWTGLFTTSWHLAANWNGNVVPDNTFNVIIPGGTVRQPNITAAHAYCKNLTVNSGGTLTVGGYTLYVNNDLTINGTLAMNNSAGVISANGNVTWGNGSTANFSANTVFWVFGDWVFQSGANANLANGVVAFAGSSNKYVRSYSTGSSFNNISSYKTAGTEVGISAWSTQPLTINGNIYVHSNAQFGIYSPYNVILKGNVNSNSAFICNNGTVVLNGSNQNLRMNTGNYFNNLTFNQSGTVTINNSLSNIVRVNGNVQILSGVFNMQDRIVQLGGNWTNSAFPTGFNAGTGRVVFNRTSGHQYIYSSENFNILEVNMNAAARVTNAAHTVTCNHYDWKKGGIDVVAGTFTANNLVQNGIYGGFWLNPGGTINLTNSDGYVDLNGHLYIFGGNFNVYGGTTSSYWPFQANASITMSGGVLDFKDQGIRIHNSASYSLTENITGGTIKSSRGFTGTRADFTPTAGTFEFYGSGNYNISQENGCTIHNIIINKNAKEDAEKSSGEKIYDARSGMLLSDGGKANILTLNSTFTLTGNLNIAAGTLNASDKHLFIGGDWTNNAGASGFLKGTSTVAFNGPNQAKIHTAETFHNVTLNKTYTSFDGLEIMSVPVALSGYLILFSGTLEVNSNSVLTVGNNISIAEGAGLNVGGLDENIHVYIGGSFFNNNNGYDTIFGYTPGGETITFNGTGDQLINTASAVEDFGNFVVNKPSGTVKPSGNIRILGDFEIVSGSFWGQTTGLIYTLQGDFTIGANGSYYPRIPSTTVFTGEDDQDYFRSPGGVAQFHDFLVDKTAVKSPFTSNLEEGEDLNVTPNQSKSKGMTLNLLSSVVTFSGGTTTIDNGTLMLNGVSMKSTGDYNINSGGMLSATAGSALSIVTSLFVNDGGVLELSGTASDNVLVHKDVDGLYQFEVNSGGMIRAQHTTFRDMDTNGLHIKPGGIVDHENSFHYCTFRHGAPAPGTLITINNEQIFTIKDAFFPANTWGGQHNVRKTTNTGHVTFDNASGDFAGSSFEDDINKRIDWIDQGIGCKYTIALYDDFGDGWNDGMLRVKVNDVIVLNSITLLSGFGPQFYYFYAKTSDLVEFIHAPGSWAYENYYHVYDYNDDLVFSDGLGGANPSGGSIIGDCGDCIYTVELTDSYGDGWNGGLLSVFVNGAVVLDEITLLSGFGPETHHFSAETGDQIGFVYTPGSWSYENEYSVFDFNGTEVFASGMNETVPTNGDLTGNCDHDLTPPILILAEQLGQAVYLEWESGTASISKPLRIPLEALSNTASGYGTLPFPYDTKNHTENDDFQKHITKRDEPCLVECPPGSIAEGEVCPEDGYIDDFNGGCNSTPPVFSTINNGDVICGTASTFVFEGADHRDTDWYEITVEEPTIITWSVVADFPVNIFIIDGSLGCNSYSVIAVGNAAPCETATATAPVTQGTYWLWVGPSIFSGMPCGTTNNYVAWVEFILDPPYFTVFRDGAPIINLNATTYLDYGIEPGSTHCYTVKEIFDTSIETGHSNELCVYIPPASYLEVDPLTRTVGQPAGTTTFDISSNITWTVAESVEWLSVSPMGGTDDGTIVVTYDLNTTISDRTGIITLSGDDVPDVILAVVQEGASGIPVNLLVENETVNNGQSECYDALQTITVQNFVVESGGEANLIAGGNIIMLAGTHAKAGSYLHARITTTGDFCGSIISMLAAEDLDKVVTHEEMPMPDQLPDFEKDRVMFRIFPNPTTGMFTLEFAQAPADQTGSMEIYTLVGERVMSEQLLGDVQHQFDLTFRPKGIYIVRVTVGEQVGIEKLVKH